MQCLRESIAFMEQAAALNPPWNAARAHGMGAPAASDEHGSQPAKCATHYSPDKHNARDTALSSRQEEQAVAGADACSDAAGIPTEAVDAKPGPTMQQPNHQLRRSLRAAARASPALAPSSGAGVAQAPRSKQRVSARRPRRKAAENNPFCSQTAVDEPVLTPLSQKSAVAAMGCRQGEKAYRSASVVATPAQRELPKAEAEGDKEEAAAEDDELFQSVDVLGSFPAQPALCQAALPETVSPTTDDSSSVEMQSQPGKLIQHMRSGAVFHHNGPRRSSAQALAPRVYSQVDDSDSDDVPLTAWT